MKDTVYQFQVSMPSLRGWVMNKANAMNQIGMAVVLLGAYENEDHVGL